MKSYDGKVYESFVKIFCDKWVKWVGFCVLVLFEIVLFVYIFRLFFGFSQYVVLVSFFVFYGLFFVEYLDDEEELFVLLNDIFVFILFFVVLVVLLLLDLVYFDVIFCNVFEIFLDFELEWVLVEIVKYYVLGYIDRFVEVIVGCVLELEGGYLKMIEKVKEKKKEEKLDDGYKLNIYRYV